MEIKFYGANCIRIANKKVSVVIDDTLLKNGKKPITTNSDISINTNPDLEYSNSTKFVVNSPGEYEVSGVSIKGLPIESHYNQSVKNTAVIIHFFGVSVLAIGHIKADLSEKQIEEFGVVDILLLPVGGGGYTLDAVEAVKLMKSVDPKIVIPTHYQSDSVKYEVPQAGIEEFLKSTNINEVETVDVLKIKDGNIPEVTKVIKLQEQ